MFVQKFIIIILVSIIPAIAFSQKKKKHAEEDTMIIVREFLDVCNLYKKMPLHLDVQYNQSATIKTSAQDSITSRAEFFLTNNGAYIRFGNTEQLVADSVMLMVSLDKQVMMVFNNRQDIKSQLGSYMGMQMTDSSVQKLAGSYTSTFLPGASEDEKIIELKNRLPLPGTDIVKEIITVRYNTRSKDPAEVTYIRRTLMLIDKKDVAELPGGHTASDLVTIEGDSFLINERKGVFLYKMIDHAEAIKLPVNMADRIRKNEQGKIVPANGFEHYYVNVE